MFGLGDELRRRQREAWDASTEALSRAELRAAAARVGRPARVRDRLRRRARARRAAGDRRQAVGRRRAVHGDPRLADHDPDRRRIVLLTNSMQSLMRAVDGLNWLRGTSRAPGAEPRARPARARRRSSDGLAFERVSFRYPGSERPILRDVDLRPAGRRGRRARRRERRRQDDARQADRPLLRADRRRDHARRRGHPPLRARGVARPT